MLAETKTKILSIEDLHPHALDHFNRFQETTRTWVDHHGELQLEDTYFIDDWNTEKKRQVIDSLKQCISTDGIVVGAYQDNKLIGFANVEGTFFGSQKQYLEMSYIHVSNGIRNAGIGRQLFRKACEQAKTKGAKKLYIGAHSSKESQAFYQAMGCVPAAEVNPVIFNREPLDIQLEITL